MLTEIQSGKRPQRPANATSLGITDPIWMLLEQCWDWQPKCRPDSHHLLSVLRETCKSKGARTATATQLKLKMNDVTISLTSKRNINPYIKLQYGSRVYTTSRAMSVGGNKYTWYGTSLVLIPPISWTLVGKTTRVGRLRWIDNAMVKWSPFNCSIVACSGGERF